MFTSSAYVRDSVSAWKFSNQMLTLQSHLGVNDLQAESRKRLEKGMTRVDVLIAGNVVER